MTMADGAFTFEIGDYREFMPVIITDQHRGRLHECPICGDRVWSCWANADNHWRSHANDIPYEGEWLKLWSILLVVEYGEVSEPETPVSYQVCTASTLPPDDAAWVVRVQGLARANGDLAVCVGVTASPIWQDEDGKRRGLHYWDAPPFPSAQGDLVAAWLRDHHPAAWFASPPNVWEALGQSEPLENLVDLAEHFDMSLSTLAHAAQDGRLPTHMPEGSTRRMARKSAVRWAMEAPGRLTGKVGRPKKAEKKG